ncbi:MAG: VOC family protein [Minwuia sp.]|uniref:VOC family protein n=1 Tax=Minwuia sp. TaxID=2493630 RepID=UPI003A892603
MTAETAGSGGPGRPRGINHLVLNVRNLEASHRFWTEVVGYVQVGELKPSEARPNPPKMRFYSGDYDGKMDHHDIALVENPDLPAPPEDWAMFGMPHAINHIAITFPDREAWLSRLKHVQDLGVRFNRRVDHGMTHSLYINDPDGYGVELIYELPREVWEGDIDAALNYVKVRSTEGEAALEDEPDDVPVFDGQAAE